jgi:16S rRNA (adenine1518-N6/adenine1519-N6)-dimethyltransferase
MIKKKKRNTVKETEKFRARKIKENRERKMKESRIKQKEKATGKIRLKKRLGQHLLKDMAILQSVVDACDITPESVVLEVGPGIANLTEGLAKRAKKVIAVELDTQFKGHHHRLQARFSNLEFIYANILDIEPENMEALKNAEDVIICGNIPYNITAPLIMKMLTCELDYRHIVFMVQKELGQRITSLRGSKDTSAFTHKVQYLSTTEYIKTVPAKAFIPPPKVQSAIIKMTPKKNLPYDEETRKDFFAFLTGTFSQRRKIILNSLGSAVKAQIPKPSLENLLLEAGIAPENRPETVNLEQYMYLYTEIKKNYNIDFIKNKKNT